MDNKTDKNTEQFCDRLNKALAERGMKQSELALKTDISKARISQYTKGLYVPKSKSTYEIAKALNVSEAWLMGMDADMERKDAVTALPAFSVAPIPPIALKRVLRPGETLSERARLSRQIAGRLSSLTEEELRMTLSYVSAIKGTSDIEPGTAAAISAAILYDEHMRAAASGIQQIDRPSSVRAYKKSRAPLKSAPINSAAEFSKNQALKFFRPADCKIEKVKAK